MRRPRKSQLAASTVPWSPGPRRGRLGCPAFRGRYTAGCGGCCCLATRRRPGRAPSAESAARGTRASGCSDWWLPAACCGPGVSCRPAFRRQLAAFPAAVAQWPPCFGQPLTRLAHRLGGGPVSLQLNSGPVRRARPGMTGRSRLCRVCHGGGRWAVDSPRPLRGLARHSSSCTEGEETAHVAAAWAVCVLKICCLASDCSTVTRLRSSS